MKIILAVCTALAWFRHAEAKTVFAHFMVSNAASFTVQQWEQQMILARDARIDGFMLNFKKTETHTPIPIAFQAAANLGNTFKLAFSFDFGDEYSIHEAKWLPDEIITFIDGYGGRDAYFKRNGQPLVSTFEGVTTDWLWQVVKPATNCFFIPSWSSLGAKNAMKFTSPDGLFSWGAWPEGKNNMFTDVDMSYKEFLGGKPYMMPVSPWFYTNMPGFNKNWLWRGEHLWFDRWTQVQFMQPEFVQIISWNDFGESHHIGPLTGAWTAFGSTQGKSRFNYALDMPHDGWRLFLPYMIETYKQGIATVTREGVVGWYRKHPRFGCLKDGTTGNSPQQLQFAYQPYDIVEDRIYFAALLGSPAEVRVSVGGVDIPASWARVPYGNVGIYIGSVEYWEKRGAVVISIVRNGATVASFTGAPISLQCTQGYQNWNAWVGSAQSSVPISVRPPLTRAQSVCTAGAGPPAFYDLCYFACQYGYCPDACTCRSLGAQRALPADRGTVGCPKPGFDSRYVGLCRFNCQRGNCRSVECEGGKPLSTVCSAPVPGDPPIPKCISGTGGNGQELYAPLCEYACSIGYCPPQVCRCTQVSFTQVQIPPDDGLIYKPKPGLPNDQHLCSYCCGRGFCPQTICDYPPRIEPQPEPPKPMYKWTVWSLKRNNIWNNPNHQSTTFHPWEQNGIAIWKESKIGDCKKWVDGWGRNFHFTNPSIPQDASKSGWACDGCLFSQSGGWEWKITRLEFFDGPKYGFSTQQLGHITIRPASPGNLVDYVVHWISLDGKTSGTAGTCHTAGKHAGEPAARETGNCVKSYSIMIFDFSNATGEEVLRCETPFDVLDGQAWEDCTYEKHHPHYNNCDR